MAQRLSPDDPRNDRIRTFEALAFLYADRNEEAARTARRIIDSQPGSGLNVFPYVVEICALVRLGRLDEARASGREYTRSLGELDWPAIERGAWSQREIDRVRDDLRAIGMIPAR